MWQCKALFDPETNSCRMLVNPKSCLGIPTHLCHKKFELEPADDLVEEMINARDKAEKDTKGEEKVLQKVRTEMENYPVVLDYLDLLEKIKKNTSAPSVWEVHNVSYPGKPAFTQELLDQACDGHINMLSIASDVLNADSEELARLKLGKMPWWGYGIDNDGKRAPEAPTVCNHNVYLQSCDPYSNTYVLWTWAKTVNLTKEILLGNQTIPKGKPWENNGVLCTGVIADRVTAQ